MEGKEIRVIGVAEYDGEGWERGSRYGDGCGIGGMRKRSVMDGRRRVEQVE